MPSLSEFAARVATILGLAIGAGIAIVSPADDPGSSAAAARPIRLVAGDRGTVGQGLGSQIRKATPSHSSRFELKPDLY